jgi:1,4-dihydroxy-2-naphthoate octaprenyltransferase
MGNLKVWCLAARPKTLWAGFVPVIIGGALAYDSGNFHSLAFVAAALGALLIQIGTNFANDLFDFLKAADSDERLGPLRATQAGLVTPAQMKIATAATFTLAIIIGVYLVLRGGTPVVIIGLVSITLGLLYTGGPIPLGYLGLGDIFVLIFFGPVAVAGTYYVVTLDINPTVLVAGLPPGMISTAILTVNNIRDIDTDRRCGKRTLAVRYGLSFARYEYLLMTAGGIIFPLFIFLADKSHPGIILSLLTLIVAFPSIRKVMTGLSGYALNDILESTGQILALFGVLFSIGWLIW